jgi:hypothetical protein
MFLSYKTSKGLKKWSHNEVAAAFIHNAKMLHYIKDRYIKKDKFYSMRILPQYKNNKIS